MESNHQLGDSKSSSGESDRSEQASDDMGTGRSYECVFCKRGFTTAQALGGHMNIHRKDRAKTRPASNSFPSVSSKPADDQYYANLGSYQPIIQSNPQISAEEHVNYQTYFLAASSWSVGSRQTHHTDDLSAQTPQCLNLYGEDWRRSLSLQIGPSHIDDIKEKRESDLKEDDQLDLELRLGYNP